MLDLGGQQNVAGPDNNVTIGLTVPLDLNGRKEGRVGVAEREVEMKQAQVADRERRLVADVRMKAGELLAARRNLGTTTDLLDANRKAHGLVRERASRGAAPPLEESLLLVEVNRLEAGLAILESRVEVLALQLKALAGLPPDEPLVLTGDLERSPSPSTAPRDSRAPSPVGPTSRWRARRRRWRARGSARKKPRDDGTRA